MHPLFMLPIRASREPSVVVQARKLQQEIITSPTKKLEEMFKLTVPANVELRVYDSTSDIRYMVLPRRPERTEGMNEEMLASLVTQESLIGVGDPLTAEIVQSK